ncbi:hypothetical protein RM52_06730 [Microbacterium hominis]|uniref:Uncharacterized protein n=1 Tax=Microbacterium hominis TaxID=162426 RepID=A0A0B4CUS8_9MICO|nr:hypothetical protein RM52_06730 [Microbacterium hominis]
MFETITGTSHNTSKTQSSATTGAVTSTRNPSIDAGRSRRWRIRIDHHHRNQKTTTASTTIKTSATAPLTLSSRPLTPHTIGSILTTAKLAPMRVWGMIRASNTRPIQVTGWG